MSSVQIRSPELLRSTLTCGPFFVYIILHKIDIKFSILLLMNYNELKELLNKYGFCIENIAPNDKTLYCFTNNPLFLTDFQENVFATAKFGLFDELIDISWFDDLSVSEDNLGFSEMEKAIFVNSPKIAEKIEKRLNKIQLDIKKAVVRLKKLTIEEDFENEL